MYVLTWKSGFSVQNVNYVKNTKVLNSLSKFHLYFWYKRFQKQPELLEKHLTRNDYKFLMGKLKLYYTWDNKYEQTSRVWGSQVKRLNEEYGHGDWDSLRVTGRYGSGYTFRVINQTLPVSPEKQYIRFIRPTSKGLDSLGQTFFMQSIEVFIYAVLGSQANSHFSIVNQGGRSFQTQSIFRQLVDSTIVQNNNTIMINNYRTAIKDTYAILNQNISPGLLIIPSSLIILDKPIPGYNNRVRISNMNKGFGTNKNLNKELLRLTGGGNEAEQRSSRTKRGTSSDALDRLKSASDNYKRGGLLSASGGKKDGGDEENPTNYSLLYFVGTFFISFLTLELVITNRGAKFRAKADVRSK